MNKTRLITFVAVGLLITNLMLSAYIFFGPTRHHFREGPKRVIAERLHFEPNQILMYEKLITAHRTDIKRLDSLMLETKKDLYATINVPDDLKKDSIKTKLGQLQIAVEDVNYNHFLDIKAICNKNQLPYFEELVKDLGLLFTKNRQRPKH